MHLVIDATGVKLYGDGEWKARRHGPSQRRTWRKLHLAEDEARGEVAAWISTNDVGDNEQLPDLLDAVDDGIALVSGDGAYDARECYAAIGERGATSTIPPRRGAQIWQHGNRDAPPLDRDENLRLIRRHGRTRWKQACGYHRRSLAETAMFRMKTLFGDHLRARCFDAQSRTVHPLRGYEADDTAGHA